jgi:hypothetical protein
MKRILIVSLVLAMAVTLLLPTGAMAAKPETFAASGVLTSIDQGNVKPLSDGRWLVVDRHIEGKFLPSTTGKANKLNGPFTITYSGVFDLTTQAGSFLGKLEAKSATLGITGKTQPFEIVGSTQVPDGQGGYITVPLCKLTISGHWIGIKGLDAKGEFNAWFVFIPTADGHVAAIVDSSFIMTGLYGK